MKNDNKVSMNHVKAGVTPVAALVVAVAVATLLIGSALLLGAEVATRIDPGLVANATIMGYDVGTVGVAILVFGAIVGVVGLALWMMTGPFSNSIAGKALGSIGVMLILIGAIVVGANAFILRPGIGPGGDDGGPPGYVADWDCNWLGTTGTAHDASTEFPDTPFIAADGGSPDYDSTIGTPVYNLNERHVEWEIAVDNEAVAVEGTGANSNAWLGEDAWAADAKCILNNPPTAVGGGYAEVPIFGSISVTRTFGASGNVTTARVWLCDSTAGWYLGFGKVADAGSVTASHTNDHEYVSYSDDLSCGNPGQSGPWRPLGSSGTSGLQNGVYIAVWQVLGVGLSSYEIAQQRLTVTVSLGMDPGSPVWRGNVEQLTITMQATHDA